MLNKSEVYAMVAVKDLAKAKKFYKATLGLEIIDEMDFGIMFRSGQHSQLFVYPTPTVGTAKSTLATWEVEDIKAVTDELAKKDIEFEHYDYPGAKHEGPIHILFGMKSAWFKDPDGNVLGLNEALKK